jgi:23S rRNA (pseudouridine1915-N3)-methyltransferase
LPFSARLKNIFGVLDNKHFINITFMLLWLCFECQYMKMHRFLAIYSKNGQWLLVFGKSFVMFQGFTGPYCDILLSMRMTLASIGAQAGKKDGIDSFVQAYLERCSGFARCQTEEFRTEKAMLEWLARHQGRTQAIAVLLDSRGRQMTSEAFAGWLGKRRDDGAQHLVFAIGPASGWSDEARGREQLLLSFGPMTMAHALARLAMAEQLYRAFTILTGHPYHAGH